MKVLVCGGRDFDDVAFAHAELDRLHKEHVFTVLIEGDAKGADRIAGEWADLHGIEHVKYPADWAIHGRAAGPIRNEQMLNEGKPDLVVALPGGRGTAHMVRVAKLASVLVIDLREPPL